MSQTQEARSSADDPLTYGPAARAQAVPRALIRISWVLSSVVLLWSIMSFSASAGSPVPIEKEPRHRLELGNQYVRVFDVLIPAGESTLFHTHVNDGVGLKLSDARIRDEVLDGEAEDLQVARGEVSFSYRPSPLTHRVSNVGRTPFRNIFVEVLRTPGEPSLAPLQVLAAERTLVVENERVRVSRQVLAPGQSLDMHQHVRSLGVALTLGTISFEVAGEKVRTVEFEPGESRWHPRGTDQSWKNVGATPFEAVIIELKN